MMASMPARTTNDTARAVFRVFLDEATHRGSPDFRLSVRAAQFARIGLNEQQVRGGAAMLAGLGLLAKYPGPSYKLAQAGVQVLANPNKLDEVLPPPEPASSTSEKTPAPAQLTATSGDKVSSAGRPLSVFVKFGVGIAIAIVLSFVAYIVYYPGHHSTDLSQGVASTLAPPGLVGQVASPTDQDCNLAKSRVAAYTCCVRQILVNYPEKVSAEELRKFDRSATLELKGNKVALSNLADVDSTVETIFSGKPDAKLLQDIREDCRHLTTEDFASDTASTSSRTESAPQKKESPKRSGSVESAFWCLYAIKDGGTARVKLNRANNSAATDACAALCRIDKFRYDCKLAK